MRTLIFSVFVCLTLISQPVLSSEVRTDENVRAIEKVDQHSSDQNSEHASHEAHESEGHEVPGWAVIPFVILLLMIATGPLFYEHFWHHNYPKIAIALAAIVVLYYIFALGDVSHPIHALFEYVQFIALLTGLFVASGGIQIDIDKKSTPMANVAILAIGAIIANIIGTTGASMLLIRPFIRLNENRIQAYHIVFFIFVISNVGGSLTPIGDPPLFLGFLKGVPFFWTLTHHVLAWAFAIVVLWAAF
jgi:Na+/H+ antiporter NhaD/arsenite permease-like protein